MCDHLTFDLSLVIHMVTTKFTKLDSILTDEIKDGIITDIFGHRGTGKTQMALQISLNYMKNGKNVLFNDTTSEFRPERFLEIIKNRNLDESILDRLQIARVTNTKEQVDLVQKIQDFENISLLIVDNVADLFSFEYSKKSQFNLKQQNFMNYIHALAQLSIEKNIPIIITNQVMKIDSTEYEKMNYSLINYTHQTIKLEKYKDHYKGTISSAFLNKIQFFYNIEKIGLTERS